MKIDEINKIISYSYPAVTSVPGVASFSNEQIVQNQNSKQNALKSGAPRRKFFQNIEVMKIDDQTIININIIVILGVNILEVCQEVQIRARYELELKIKSLLNLQVNVFVKDILDK